MNLTRTGYSTRSDIVGHEKTPVISIDNAFPDLISITDFAHNDASFKPDSKTAYPGIRALLPTWYIQELIHVIVPHLKREYPTLNKKTPSPVMAYFSLLTHRETELSRFQRVPHFDSLNVDYFALVHYLNPGNFGGTGFFRHRPTGFERLTQDRFPQFTQAAEAHFRMHGEPAAQYIRSSNDHFELIATMNYRPNRIIAYPGNLLHSGIVHPEKDIDANPVTGRLTANLFLQFD